MKILAAAGAATWLYPVWVLVASIQDTGEGVVAGAISIAAIAGGLAGAGYILTRVAKAVRKIKHWGASLDDLFDVMRELPARLAGLEHHQDELTEGQDELARRMEVVEQQTKADVQVVHHISR